MSEGEETLALFIRTSRLADIDGLEREYKFHPSRKWRADFAWPKLKILVEVEGGTWQRGRHSRGHGFEKDCEKYNAAAALGYFVFRFTTDMVNDGRAIATLESVLPPF